MGLLLLRDFVAGSTALDNVSARRFAHVGAVVRHASERREPQGIRGVNIRQPLKCAGGP